MLCRYKAPCISNKAIVKQFNLRPHNTKGIKITRLIHVSLAVPKQTTLSSNYLPLFRTTTVSFFSTSRSRNTMSVGPIQQSIEQKLQDKLNPSHLEVINESYMHSVPKGSESHFKVVIVSNAFENMSLLQRHRTVNEILEHELKTGVHALSIQAKTPQQWEQSNHQVSQSPACLGGMAKEKK